MRRRIWLVLLLGMFTVPLTAADSGFRCNPDGFGFRNYGNTDDIQNLVPEDMVRMFGPGAVAGKENGEIYLVPAAQEWMEIANDALDGGHCEGFAVLAHLFHQGHMQPSAFGGERPVDLKLAGNEPLQREIAYWWATQLTETTRSARVKGTPTEVLERLREGLAAGELEKAYTVAIFMPNWTRGHAVTPYRIVDDGSISRIMIYDNNFPNQERFIEVDRENDTWGYSTASNPNEGEFSYTGDATTKTMFLTPCAPRLGRQKADFLDEADYADDPGLENPDEDGLEPGEDVEDKDDDEDLDAEDSDAEGDSDSSDDETQGTIGSSGVASASSEEVGDMEIILSGEGAELLITDAKGKRLGYASGTFYNEIPGAEVVRVVGAADWNTEDVDPRYVVPDNRKYLVTITGTVASPSEAVSVTSLGRGTEVTVDEIWLEKGQTDKIYFDSDGKGVRYRPGGEEHPTLEVGYQGKTADFEIVAKGIETSPGGAIELEILPKIGCAQIQVVDSTEPATVEVQIRRLSENAVWTFKNDDLTLGKGDKAYFHFAAWKSNKVPMKVDLDRGGDGKVDTEWEAADEE